MSKVSGTTEISAELAAKMGIPKTQAAEITKNFVEVLSSAICNGGVSFKGVMTIKPKLRKGRTGTISFGASKGQQWKSEDKYVLDISTGSDMDAQLNN